MKKFVAVTLVLLMLCAVPTSVFAMDTSDSASGGNGVLSEIAIQPRWANVLSATPVINTIDNIYTCSVVGVTGTTKISCTMVLYQKGLFGYTEVDRASGTANAQIYTFSDGYSYKAGTTYKMEASITVTRNGVNETVSVYTEKTA